MSKEMIAVVVLGVAAGLTCTLSLMLLQIITPQVMKFYNILNHSPEMAAAIIVAACGVWLIRAIFSED